MSELNFIQTPEGNIDFGHISEEIGRIIGRESAPIRLQEGNEKFGINHISPDKKQAILKEGYPSIEEFVLDIVQKYQRIYEGYDRALLLVKKNGKNKMAVIQLQTKTEVDRSYYTVITAFVVRKDFFNN